MKVIKIESVQKFNKKMDENEVPVEFKVYLRKACIDLMKSAYTYINK